MVTITEGGGGDGAARRVGERNGEEAPRPITPKDLSACLLPALVISAAAPVNITIAVSAPLTYRSTRLTSLMILLEDLYSQPFLLGTCLLLALLTTLISPPSLPSSLTRSFVCTPARTPTANPIALQPATAAAPPRKTAKPRL